jgi:hypothetical protein
MLQRLPDIAAEVWLTRNHPNPGGEQVNGRSGRNIHIVPLDLTAWDALRPDDHGQLAQLSACVHLVAKELRDAGQPWPKLTNPPTWVSECGWLIETAGWWQRQAWHGEIDHQRAGEDDHERAGMLPAVWKEMTRAARIPAPLNMICPRCRMTVHGKADQQGGPITHYVCEGGHTIDHHAEIRRMGELQEMTSTEIETHLSLTRRTLRNWKAAGVIVPVGKRNLEDVWIVSEVRKVQDLTRKVRA